jgi:very-short-patch-repair endonuclease
MAAVLAGGPGAVLSHRSAAAVLDLRVAEPAYELTVPSGRRPRPGFAIHVSALGADEVTRHHGLPITTVARTLLDLAGVLGPAALARAVNEAEFRRLADPLGLPALLERHPRRPGAAALRAILADRALGLETTDSELEAAFLELVVRRGLPRPRLHMPMRVDGVAIEPDCVWPEQRLIAELDGHAAHATWSRHENDRARDRRLRATGWTVVRITARQLVVDRGGVERDLLALLRPAAPVS